MKRIIVLLVTLFAGYSLLANNNHPDTDFSRLKKLLPNKVTRFELKQLFGDASYININNKKGEEVWEYKTEAHDIVLRWDTKNDQFMYFSYTSANSTQLATWSNQYMASVEMGTSTVADVINVLGAPRGISVSAGDQRIQYSYTNTNVELQFKNGVLANYRVTASPGNKG